MLLLKRNGNDKTDPKQSIYRLLAVLNNDVIKGQLVTQCCKTNGNRFRLNISVTTDNYRFIA